MSRLAQQLPCHPREVCFKFGGKAKAMGHVWVNPSDEPVPMISVDYCFMTSKDVPLITDKTQSRHSTVLVVR